MKHAMLWAVVPLLAAALSVESYSIHDHERLVHGRQLKIYLSRNAEKLEFIPAFEPNKIHVYWQKGHTRVTKGRISGSGNDRRWYIDQVTYEDQGTYIERDFWQKEISEFKVAVTPRHNYVKCIAGETLYISLEGIDRTDAALTFAAPTSNITLVQDGSRVSQDLLEYFDRVYVMSKIEIRNVNTSDEGYYYLRDRKDRLVSVTRMDLTDKHDTVQQNPLMALLLLLGIPAGICCCCRKKIFKKQKASTTETLQTSPAAAVHPPPGGPVGPSPPYNSPGQPGAVYIHNPDPSMGPSVHPPPPATGPAPWNGPPPSPGFNPAYPPQNPAYPPAGPAMAPPAGPQWNGPPPGQYPPGPGAPMGYAPVMYSSPPPAAGEPVKEEIKMENMAPSPADPLLNTTPEAAAPSAPGPPTSTSHQYNIDGVSGTNFL